MRGTPLLLPLLLCLPCNRGPEGPPPSGSPEATGRLSVSVPGPAGEASGPETAKNGALTAPASAAAASAVPPAAPWSPADYPWLADTTLGPFKLDGTLDGRFPPPRGMTRASTATGSFGAWLQRLPLTPPKTPVMTYKDKVLWADHDNIAAVVALDIGHADLQQCADSVIRLHAEWLWSRGRRDQNYRAASGSMMPFARWARGERPVAEGNTLTWHQEGKASAEHSSFRHYLDSVFNWANTGSLARQAAPTTLAALRPGDFVVMPGSPGHAVLVLDLATGPGGQRAVLLGQGYMPAQSFQVLRPEPESVWFPIDEASGGIKTPFWEIFPWSALRRLDD